MVCLILVGNTGPSDRWHNVPSQAGRSEMDGPGTASKGSYVRAADKASCNARARLCENIRYNVIHVADSG